MMIEAEILAQVPDEPYVAAPEEELKEEGNRLFSLRRYAKAAEKCGFPNICAFLSGP